jgi:DNA-binding NarL/FixJ family response regulator
LPENWKKVLLLKHQNHERMDIRECSFISKVELRITFFSFFGLTNKEIGKKVSLDASTVKGYRRDVASRYVCKQETVCTPLTNELGWLTTTKTVLVPKEDYTNGQMEFIF